MEMTKSLVLKMTEDWWFEEAEMHRDVLLGDPQRYMDALNDHFYGTGNPFEDLSYEQLNYLAKENREYLNEHKNEFYTVQDIEVCLTGLFSQMVFLEVVNRIVEFDEIMFFLKDKICEDNVSNHAMTKMKEAA